MNNTKRRAIMFMVSGATIGAVAVGAYFLQNDRTPPATDTPPTATSTPSIFDMKPIIPEAKVSTEGWKTCRNEEYGWEVQYPGDWYVYGEGHHSGVEGSTWGGYYANETECVGGGVVIAEWDPGTPYASLGGASVSIIAGPTNMGVRWEHITNVRDFAQANSTTKVDNLYIIDNEDAILYRPTDSFWSIHVYHDMERYNITSRSIDFNILETMLSTFRFLDIATSTTSVK